MATTCDYCHKPLSLMRRLRGEQFCSVEHLDLYTAQQAEFALQRLAASVEDRPTTARPPALLKRIARTPVEANGHVNGKNGSNGNGSGTLVHEPVQEAPPPPPSLDGPSEAFLRVAGGNKEEPPIRLRKIEPPVAPEPAQPEYPMAGFILDATGPRRGPAGAPALSVDPEIIPTASCLPRLRVEPIATPAVAPLQPLAIEEPPAESHLGSDPLPQELSAFADLPRLHVEPIATPTVAPLQPLTIEEPAAESNLTSDPLPQELIGLADLPRLHVDPMATPPVAPLQSLELQQLSTDSSRLADPLPQHLDTVTEMPRLAPEPRTVVESWSNQKLIGLFVAPIKDARASELLPRPEGLPAEFTAPKPQVTSLRRQTVARLADDLLIEPPVAGAVAFPGLELQSVLPESIQATGFTETFVPELELAAPDAEPFVRLPLAPRITWTAQPLASTFSSGLLHEALEPEIAREFPATPAWSLTQAFVAPSVAIPASEPKTALAHKPSGEEAWMASNGKVQTPRMPSATPHFTKPGPTFGWEDAQPKNTAELRRMEAGDYTHLRTAEIVSMPVAPQVRPAIADLDKTLGNWTQPHNSELTSIAPTAHLQTTGLSPRIRDFRARVEARLDAVRLQEAEEWSAPRIDSTMLAPSVPANGRPASSPVDLRLHPISTFGPIGFSHLGQLIPERTALGGPAVPQSEPSSWAFPSGQPHAPISLEPSAALRPGKFAPNAPMSHQPPLPTPDLQPVRYRAVSLVVVPPPNYRLRPGQITEEGRYAALAPNGVYRLPRIRHTGYRMPGPYPKLPRQLPEHYLAHPVTQVPPPIADMPLTWAHTRQDQASVPSFDSPAPTRIHPADYFSWPAIKTPRADRILPRQHDTVLGPAVGNNPTHRRFGPTRAGLQTNPRKADPLSRTGA